MRYHLLLHGVGTPKRELEPGEADVWISPQQLREFLAVIEGNEVLLSVDDGNRSDLEFVLPALQERRLRATFFPIAGRIGQPGSLSAAGIRELRDAGMGIGSHGFRHRPWRRLSQGEAEEEFVAAREILEDEIQQPIFEAACPRGAYDRRSLAALRNLDYAKVYTSDRGPSRPGSWLQARDSVRAWDDAGTIAEAVIHGPSRRTRAIMKAKRLVKRLR